MEGYVEALKKHNINYDEELMRNCGNDADENYEIIKSLLASDNPPDGIFASVETLAITTYYVCNHLNISIPAQLKVIGFSNLATAPLLNPSLTTITQPAFNIGKEATSILFQKLKKNSYLTNDNVILKSTLIKRNSTKAF
jgi:LacI family transcriptional regulator